MRRALHTECYPISILPRLSRLFVDYAASREPLAPFYAAAPYGPVWKNVDTSGASYGEIADLLEAQNRAFGASAAALANIDRLRAGAAAIVTGQQVTLFGGPLFTLLKAATAIRKAKDAGAVPIFWLATEDHDLAEADHVTLPSRHELHRLRLEHASEAAGKPVGAVRLGEGIRPLLEQAAELLGPGEVGGVRVQEGGHCDERDGEKDRRPRLPRVHQKARGSHAQQHGERHNHEQWMELVIVEAKGTEQSHGGIGLLRKDDASQHRHQNEAHDVTACQPPCGDEWIGTVILDEPRGDEKRH